MVERWRLSARVRDEEGLTTLGMAVALLVTLSLVFSTAQVYRIGSASAEIQEVADAAALAAQSEVAEYMVAVRVCDAVVLSMNLMGSALYGVGVAAACVPATQGASAALMNMGKQMFSARDAFSQRATAGLNQLQRALPFLAAAKAASLAAAQDGALGTAYFAVAVLVPSEGVELRALGDAGSASVAGAIEEGGADLAADAQAAEEAAQAAHEAKLRGFEADCGAAPEPCMYERASRLAGLGGTQNPRYESVDAWTFSVALERARAYYAERLEAEAPASSGVEERARSALRTQFYAYASAELARAYVIETEDSFDASFPVLPANAAEVRASGLYDGELFPVSGVGADSVLHAWDGCPGASSPTGRGSLRQMEEGAWRACPQCGFDVSAMGSVAAASTSIENGFEHHYRAMAQAASDYELARARLDPLSSQVKDAAGGFIDDLADVVGNAGSARIQAQPPGSKGCVVFAVGGESDEVDAGLTSSFAPSGRTLGARVAVSAATLVEDPSGEGASVVASLLDGFASQSAAAGVAGAALDAWSAALGAYAEGQSALTGAVEGLLGGIPLGSKSNLGVWAAERLEGAFSAVGLQPADIDALKPVLVNSAAVAAAGSDAFSTTFLSLKTGALGISGPSTNAFSSALVGLERVLAHRIEDLEDGFEIARVDIGFAGVSVPVKIALPHAAGEGVAGFVEARLAALRQAYFEAVEARVWE